MMQATVHVIATLRTRPGQEEAARVLLCALLAPTRAEPGCLRYQLLQESGEGREFRFVEEWESEAALEAHLASPHIQQALPALLPLLEAGPDIRRYRPVG